MNKKIVAIGGGENGRIDSKGIKKPYELANQDKEIIKLTGKKHPNFLLIAHSQLLEKQESYFEVMTNIYEKIYGCPCKNLKSDILDNKKQVQELINWADIIFEGGGNTLNMIKLWKDTGFDEILKRAWEDGKVMCGVSAGANCWFKECSSDSVKNQNNKSFIKLECLGFINALFIPHSDNKERLLSAKELLKDTSLVGIALSNCCAIEIIDDKYRLITSDASYHNIKAFGLKLYWNNGKYYEEIIKVSTKFRPLSELIKKDS